MIPARTSHQLMAVPIGSRLGPYEILDAIGQGAMGEVYRARDTRLDRTVAVKVLPDLFAADPDRLARFEREAKSVAQLSHPNILGIFDFGMDSPTAYAVMELLEGETLAERLARGPVPPAKAIGYAIQIANGLAAAHGRGIVHRDVKPANLFVTHDDRVKILDFGLAKPLELAASDATVGGVSTSAGLVMGTLGYMAPEQVRAQPTDHRADLFAFGAVLYEMVSGRRAFRGDSPADTISAILNSEPPDLDTSAGATPPALERIIRRCLEKKPELRFQSAQDLAFAFETLSSRGSGAVAVTPDPAASRPLPAVLPWIVAAVAVIVVAASWTIGGPAPSREVPSGELRLSIVPPVGHQFAQDNSDFNPEFAISPDGSRIAFLAVDATGVSTVWVRDLASVTPQQLVGGGVRAGAVTLSDAFVDARLRHDPDVWLRRCPPFRILQARLVIAHRPGDDDVFTRLPVGRRGDFVRRGELKRVEYAQHLVEVPAGGHRIHEHELDLLVGPDDEDVADRLIVGRRAAVARAFQAGGQHAIQFRHAQIRVADHREVRRVSLRFPDVLRPARVVLDRVDAEPDHLRVPPVELRFDLRHVAELGRAHRREVLGV